jgi:hypothetical protein
MEKLDSLGLSSMRSIGGLAMLGVTGGGVVSIVRESELEGDDRVGLDHEPG